MIHLPPVCTHSHTLVGRIRMRVCSGVHHRIMCTHYPELKESGTNVFSVQLSRLQLEMDSIGEVSTESLSIGQFGKCE
jgi:hypothetical protein